MAKSIMEKFYTFLASTKLFSITVGLLVVQSVWLAFTAIYPLPFDEYMHFGVTKFQATHWLPFFSSQPAEAALYGDITRDPSYLYSYLMSFPYRLIHFFTNNQQAMVISLRLINILFVCIGLILFRKLLSTWGVSKRITNTVLLALVCTPIVPFLAAHINYDNLMFALTPLFLLVATRLLKSKDQTLENFLWLGILGMVTSLVKHNFLPIFFIVSAYVLIVIIYRNRHDTKAWISSVWRGRPRTIALLALSSLFLVSGGLFFERHGINLIRFGQISPDCAQIQPESVCENFMPWYRNQQEKLHRQPNDWYGNPVSFTQHWVSKMARGYFAIFSHTPTNVISSHEPFGPIVLKGLLPMQIIFASVVMIIGFGALLLSLKRIWKNQFLRLSFIVSVGYLVILWLFNYRTYQQLGAALAIQARYTIPILIIIFLLVAQSFNFIITSKKVKQMLVVMLLIFYCWGGGIVGYLIRADDNWYWQNPTVIHVNQSVQEILRNVTIH